MKNTRALEKSKVELLSSTDDESVNNSIESDDKHFEFENNTAGEVHKIKRGRKNIITPELAAALDRIKVSDRKAAFVISETAKSLGQNINEFALNKDSMRRQRMKERTQKYEIIKAKFEGHIHFVIHWD